MRQNRFTWDQIQFPAQQLHWKLEVDRGWQSKSQAKCQSQQHLFQTKKKILQENSNKQRFKQAHLAP